MVYGAVRTAITDQVGWGGVYGKGHLGVSFLRGSMCAEGMGCEPIVNKKNDKVI